MPELWRPAPSATARRASVVVVRAGPLAIEPPRAGPPVGEPAADRIGDSVPDGVSRIVMYRPVSLREPDLLRLGEAEACTYFLLCPETREARRSAFLPRFPAGSDASTLPTCATSRFHTVITLNMRVACRLDMFYTGSD